MNAHPALDRPDSTERSPGATRLIVVSDLHLSAGTGSAHGSGRHDPFRDESCFLRFVDYLGERLAGSTPPLRLLVLGDLLDLLHVTKPAGGAWRETSEAASLEKLERIAAAHPAVFRALRELLAAGVAISVVPGNHDIELVLPALQRRFAELVGHESQSREASIDFDRWIFYRPGVVYGEHGSQYHDLNAFATPLHPLDERGDELDLPLGSELTLYLLDLAAAAGVGLGDDAEAPKRIVAALRRQPPLVLSTARAHAGFLAAAVRHWTQPLGSTRRRQRAAYRTRTLSEYAGEVGLGASTIRAIDDLAALAPFAIERRVLRALVAGRLQRMLRAGRAGVASTPYLERAARRLDSVLGADRVPLYVFGHTHEPADRALLAGNSVPRYLNAGTWSTLLPRSARRLGEHGRRSFIDVELLPDEMPTARLMWWNDERGAPERHPAAPGR